MDEEQIMNILTLVCLSFAAYLIIKQTMESRGVRRGWGGRRSRYSRGFEGYEAPAQPAPIKASIDPKEVINRLGGGGCNSPDACDAERQRINQEVEALGGEAFIMKILNSSSNSEDATNQVVQAIASYRQTSKARTEAIQAEKTNMGGNGHAEKQSFLRVEPAMEQPKAPRFNTPPTPKITPSSQSQMGMMAKYQPSGFHCSCTPGKCLDMVNGVCTRYECQEVHCMMPQVKVGKKEGFCMEGLCGL